MPMPPVPPIMGGANPQNLEALAAAGDPRAIMLLQQQAAQQGVPPGPDAAMVPPAQTPDVQASRVRQLIKLLRGQ